MKKLIIPPLMCVMFMLLAGYSLAFPMTTLSIYFTDNVRSEGVTITVQTMEQELIDLIDSAESSIDLAIYDFNRDSILTALTAAHLRGVRVRVVTDDETRFGNESYAGYYGALELAGVQVVDDDRPSTIMHNKFFVFDKEVVWTGSTNVTDNGFTKNHNNSIVIQNTNAAELYTAEFEQMLNGDFSIHKSEFVTTTFGNVEIHFSPEGPALNSVIEQVNRAEERILFSIFFSTNDELRDALIAAKVRGVAITGIWDHLGASNSFSDDETLCEAGIQIKREGFKGKMHRKSMVIDDTVVTGSMNWTNSGANRNDENTVILHDAGAADLYGDEFWGIYAAIPNELACRPIYEVWLPILGHEIKN